MTRIPHIRVEAPSHMEPLEIAQAIVGPDFLLKAESAYRPSNVRFRPLKELLVRVGKMYTAQLQKLQDAVKKYVEKEIIHGKLEKAGDRPKPIITPEQLEEIAELIRDYHKGFMIGVGLEDIVNADEIQRLVSLGVVPAEAVDLVGDAFTMGQLSASVQDVQTRQQLSNTTYSDFKRRVERTPVPITENERRALSWSRHSTAIHMRGMGDKISDDVSTSVISQDAEVRRKYMSVVRDSVQQGIEERKAWRRISSEIGHATGDWARDMMRVAATETQMAYQEGFAENLIKREGEPDSILVAKRPAPGACKHCIRLHLTAGLGSPPRIFKLSELTENGTNVGRKAADWQPVVGPVHPWCACELIHLPPGFGFEKNPPENQGWEKIRGKSAWRKKSGEDWEYWSPQMVLDSLRRGLSFDCDLAKSFTTLGNSVEVEGCVIRVNDPSLYSAISKVVDTAPQGLFHKEVGVTAITTDHPRTGVALEEHDLAYWTGNEIRISQDLNPDDVELVLQHELGHAPNVYLIRKMGSEHAVRQWHNKLYDIARKEGFVSVYAKKLPIECAAEVTRLYLFDRRTLMDLYPRQFAFVHAAYREVLG